MAMSKPPDYLPEEQPGARKPKEDYYYEPVRRRGGCGWLAVLALLAGIALGAAGVIVAAIVEPSIVNLLLDTPPLSGTERALALTGQANDLRATQAAADAIGTQNALATREANINQEATQGAQILIATRTAIAIDNAQRATQFAFSLNSTQAAIYLYATQVQAQSLQQQEQFQLNQTATQLAVNAAATQAQLSVEFSSTQAAQQFMATGTPTPVG
jgi:hypothetical protein